MPPIVSKLKGKILHSQSREIVANVYDYMKDEAKEKNRFSREYFEEVMKVQKRVAAATGVSHSSVYRILEDRRSMKR